MRRWLLAWLLLVALLAGGTAACSLPTPTPRPDRDLRPDKITEVSAVPGPQPGEVTVRWQSAGGDTTSFQVETAVSPFSPTKESLPQHGRHAKLWTVPAAQRSVTLSAGQVASSGASPQTGNLLYYRVYAVNETSSGPIVRHYPRLNAVLPQPVPPKPAGTQLTAATFNVRSARKVGDERQWLERVPDVARDILRYRPGVVALQELTPGRADGRIGSAADYPRQTTSLLTALRRAGGRQYALVRTTPYVKPGTPSGSQGARILYDTRRYRLLSDCPDTTGRANWSGSCTIPLPLSADKSASQRRKAAYALFADRRTGQRFFVVSAHLDSDHSSDPAKERRLEAHRGRQISAVVDAVSRLDRGRLPVVLGADLNSWQNNRVADEAHEILAARGYYDTSSALQRVNMGYSTLNQFKETVTEHPLQVPARFDVVTVSGGRGAARIVNVLEPVDAARPSDHNLVVADVVL